MKKSTLLTEFMMAAMLLWSVNLFAQEAIPFSEDFEDGSLQSYWTTGGSGTPTVLTTQVYSGTYALDFNAGIESSSYVEVELETVTDPVLSFWYYFESSYQIDLTVDIYTNGSWTTEIWTDNVDYTGVNQWLHAEVDLASYNTESGSLKLRFTLNHDYSYEGYNFYMDEVSVGGPSNPSPNNSSNNDISGMLTWDHAVNVSKYDIKLGEAGNMTTVESGASVSGSSGSYSYSGLDYQKEYQWQIIYYKADATQIDGSIWSFHTYFGSQVGSESDPYEIANTDDLIALSQNSDYWEYHYEQTADITFDADEAQVDWDGDGSAGPAEGFLPIGNGTTNFTGSYDGQNHTIDYLYINREYDIGLFGYVYEATIQNLGVTNVTVNGWSDIGGLAGVIDNSEVKNSNSSGIVNVTSSTGESAAGGLVGLTLSGSNIENSYSDATIEDGSSAGGLVGENRSSTISNSYSLGNVGNGDKVGGLVGFNRNGTILESFSTGDVDGTDKVGGLVGSNRTVGWDEVSCTINNSYSNGDVTRNSGSNATFGGFVGYVDADGSITNCYATGNVVYDGATDPTDKGFLGEESDNDNSTTYTANFFNSEASNQSSATGATGKTNAEMQTQSTFTGAGWDFTSNWEMSSPVIENGYPHLQWENITTPVATSPSQVSGKYQIATLDDLRWIAEDDSRWSNDYEQTADIDANVTSDWDNGKGWTPIGNSTTNFTGTYDGQDHTINNLYINRSSENFMGLFGYILGDDDNEFISELGLINVDITGQNIVGGIAGMKMGPPSNPSLMNCYVTGQVSGEQNIGALVGENQYSIIAECFSNVTINGTNQIGGIAGYAFQTTINNCYSLGDVTRSSGTETDFGVFCGLTSDSDIENCYATGNVVYDGATDPTDKGFVGSETGTNTYTANFFDSNASNQSTATGATGKNTDEMTAYATFSDSGWSFCPPETHSDGNWIIDESTTSPDNDGYPALFWQGLTNNYIESTPGLWTGADPSDNNWNNPGNWDDGQVPDATVDVTIPDTGNDPVISAEGTCQNITIQANSTLTINSSQTLAVTGNFTLEASGDFTNNGTMKFSGTGCELKDNRTEQTSLGNLVVE